MKNNLKIINKMINAFFIGLVVLLPIYFLPWTSTLSGMDNFNKQNLLFLLMPLIGFLFFYARFKQGKIGVKCSVFDYPILAFLGITAVASIFSYDKFSSVFGGYSYIEQSFIMILCLFLLYYFTINFFSKETEVGDFLKIFFKIYAVVVSVSSILVFSYWSKILSSNTVSVWFKLSVGTLDDLAMFLAVINVLLFALLYDQNYAKDILKSIFQQRLIKTLIVLSFVLLILINFSPAWICMLVGSVFVAFVEYFYFGAKKISCRKKLINFVQDTKVLWLNIAILIPLAILIFNMFTYSGNVSATRYAQKLQMNQASSLELSRQVMKSRPIFGFGPETYTYAFSMLRSAGDNNSEFWYLRYNHGSSYFLNLIEATGVVGFFSYLVIIGLIFYVIILTLRRNHKKDIKQDAVTTSVMAVVITLVVGQIFYSVNIVLLFLFWLFLGLLMVCVQDYFKGKKEILVFQEKVLKNEISQRTSLIVVFGLFFVWIFVMGLLSRYWVADYDFKKSLEQKDYVGTERYLHRAVSLNPERYNYQIAMAKFYKEKTLNEMSQKNKNIEVVKSDIGNSIALAKAAIKQAPYSVVAYETLGSIYRDLSPYIQGDSNLVIETFKQAANLEPSNPVLMSELGNAYLTNSLFTEAINAFQFSLKLRNDNYDAAFGLGQSLVAIGQTQEAMNVYRELEKKYPTADVYYEEGRILFNLKNYEAAIVKFQQVISISPLHSNALYSLGLALDANGEKEAALHYYKKVLELNPGNVEVQGKIDGLGKK